MRAAAQGIGWLLVCAVLAGCASGGGQAVRPGVLLDDVQAQWGAPKAVYQHAQGQRVFYSPQPWQVRRLDFDAQGRLQQIHEQVLSVAQFAAIEAGKWRATDVQQTFGPPARRATDADKGSVWSYFFLEYGVHRRARIHFDAGGNVARVDVAEDPAADDRYR